MAKVSKSGYKRNSKDKNEPALVIPSNNITMKGVDFPVYGIDNTGYTQMMYPGGEYQFPGNMVYEIPMAQDGIEMPFGLPLRSANPSAPYAYESPVANGYLLPDPNRPELLNTGATEYKMGVDDVVIPTVVNGNYMSPDDAYARYLITGEQFIPTANPESYSRFYDTISQLGLMKQQRGGDPSIPDLSNRGWLEKYQSKGEVPREKQLGPRIEYLPQEEFKPKPNIPVYEDPIKKGYVAKQVPGVHGSMKTVYVNPKTQDVIETPEETRKQMAMDQIARSNNIDPIGVGILAASGAAPLARTVGAALPFLDAPLTIGSTVVPGVTASNIAAAAGAGYSTAQVLDPNSELRTNPNAENVLTTGLGFVGLPYKTAALSFADDLGQAGKYLTTQTPLKNAYKYNPWAEKLANPNRSYRVAGMDAARDFEATGVLRSNPTIVKADLSEGILGTRTTPFPSFQKGYADLRYLPEEGGVIFETDLPTFKRGEINPFTGKKIKGSHYAHRVIDPTTGKVLTEIPSENVRMFGSKPHWLRGYKPINTPKQLPGSANNTFLKPTVIYPKPNQPLPDYTEPYLGKTKKPISRQEEIFRSFLSPEEQARLRADDWIYYDPQGNIIPRDQYPGRIEYKYGGWLDNYK